MLIRLTSIFLFTLLTCHFMYSRSSKTSQKFRALLERYTGGFPSIIEKRSSTLRDLEFSTTRLHFFSENCLDCSLRIHSSPVLEI